MVIESWDAKLSMVGLFEAEMLSEHHRFGHGRTDTAQDKLVH